MHRCGTEQEKRFQVVVQAANAVPTFARWSASNRGASPDNADSDASDTGDSDCFRGMDNHSRRSFPGIARLLQTEERVRSYALAAQVFLPLHLRILLQPLRCSSLSDNHPVPAHLSRLARISGFTFRAGLDCEFLHGSVCPSEVRYSSGANRDQVQGSGPSVETTGNTLRPGGLMSVFLGRRRTLLGGDDRWFALRS